MNQLTRQNKPTMAEAGYEYNGYLKNVGHILMDMKTRKKEVWVANKNHASYGIKWRNTHLEFVRTFKYNLYKEIT